MPPQLTMKSPRPRKTNPVIKTKGAVRAKSGCYTCRIRRKKCDEKRINNEDGPCETCIRLKLKCLGFGAKRPDWLRENTRIQMLRDRIKAHLAAQGMIKGHAGSGSRTAVQEEILRLSDFRDGPEVSYGSPGSSASSSSAGSPRGREDSVESDHPHHHHYSAGRLVLPYSLSQAQSSFYPPHHYGGYERHGSTHSGWSPDLVVVKTEIVDEPCLYLLSELHESYSPTIGPQYEPPEEDMPGDIEHYSLQTTTPATRSSFSRDLYHAQFKIEDDPDPLFLEGDPIIMHFYPSTHLPFEFLDESLRHYVDNVVKIQYLLGDKNLLPQMIWRSIKCHEESHEAVTLLSRAYYGRQDNPSFSVLADTSVIGTIDSLKNSLSLKSKFSADDAMTALHVVSLYLFEGGRGRWDNFLAFAIQYVKNVLDNPTFMGSYSVALEAANPKDEFVVKTTIWFDVLAAITTQQPPMLMTYIRELFSPTRSYVGPEPGYSMLDPMGCTNTVLWALAETTYIAYWKRRHEEDGNLSVRELVRKVSEIEQHLQPLPRPYEPQKSSAEWSRFFASEMFRTGTKLFLKTVENGDFPLSPDIQESVNEAFKAIVEPKHQETDVKAAIVRSTVFPIFICGAFTLAEDQEKRRELRLQLMQNSGHEGVGNCATICNLLERLWDSRQVPNVPVEWRRYLRDAEILLV
ncbi:hypothetical protein M413DRAFT_29155 [Hebeloma cylindrosporum]|uniref:Zn(2)-C6 fungal-type domain-containing protein n=1 Tax=Hebeloma cylindrosporum TaxID=76867 RepID=A0A0C3BTM3_HEBCY|nr:hypothetical protein M413DRAFT_29155 [Hebeloma cylindrosporum h7]